MNHTTIRMASFVEALAESGLRHVCISPGARNTPLAHAFASNNDVEKWIHHDERSAGFFALGIGKVTGGPAALVCTSGSAVTHYLPAITEAKYSRTPMIILSADRPPELRDVGAPQAIDQVKVFAAAVKWAHEAGLSDATTAATATRLAAQTVAESLDTPPGPVHVNFPFRAPLMPGSPVVPANAGTVPRVVRGETTLSDGELEALLNSISGLRGLLAVGHGVRETSEAAGLFAQAAGWPILADPLSGLRAGPHGLGGVLAHGDLLAAGGYFEKHAPEVVLRTGAIPTSKPFWTWLKEHPAIPQILIDPSGWSDPTSTIATLVRADPDQVLRELAKRIEATDKEHRAAWIAADGVAASAANEAMGAAAFPNEPHIAALVGAHVPGDSVLVVGSSMPIRDVDTFMAVRPDPLTTLGNRGTNGIDGLLSMALGAAAGSQRRTTVLTGDVGALHDLTALVTAARLDLDFTVVIVDNDGGGIFHFLPQVELPEFEEYFGTPHGVDFVSVASAFGVPATTVDTAEALVSELGQAGPRVIVIRTDRRKNVEVHARIREAVSAALR